MRDRVLVGGIGRRGEAGVEQSGQAFGAGLRAVHADQRPDAGDARGRGSDRRDHVVGVDHDTRLVIGEVVVEFVGEADVDQRRDRADPPAGEQAQQIIHAVMGEDRDAVALAHAEMMQRAGEALHRGRPLPAKVSALSRSTQRKAILSG